MKTEKYSQENQISLSEDLNQLEDYIEDFWKFLPIPVCYVNPLFNVLDEGGKLVELSGYKQTETIGSGIENLFKNKEEVIKIEEKLRSKKPISGKEAIFLTKRGKEIPVSISSMPRKDEQGNITGYFLSFLDITERKIFEKELEKKIQKKTKQLQEKVSELEKMNKLMVGRELKMIELKNRIKKLREDVRNLPKIL